jgi:hypothetical protein
MEKMKLKLISKQIFYGVIALVMIFAFFPSVSSAGQITPRKVTIGTSLASASTSYNFLFTLPSATVVQSVKLQACDTASGACTQTGAANGFSSSAGPATLNGAPTGLGAAGTWTINTADATSLRILNASNSGAPGAAVVNFNAVRNPSASNSTFFMRITSYSDAAWTTPIDTGVVATSTAGQITVTASVDESLTFTLATATVAMGTLTSSTTGKGSSAMIVGTNGATGYTVGYKGATLTSAGGTITALASPTASSVGNSQFGINLMANATTGVGVAKSGLGTGVVKPASGYDVTEQFKFIPAGEDVATASGPTDVNTFTTSYIANIGAATAAGAYSTVITYTATANF